MLRALSPTCTSSINSLNDNINNNDDNNEHLLVLTVFQMLSSLQINSLNSQSDLTKDVQLLPPLFK